MKHLVNEIGRKENTEVEYHKQKQKILEKKEEMDNDYDITFIPISENEYREGITSFYDTLGEEENKKNKRRIKTLT